ncbi:Phospholipase A2 [Operophtera brumata]|uniref:Phospholipase A2 n=1 Tax=Operophtera brumata TaxID=104452 RepID=A0A0L7KRL0_OPEBR|nr:Phospholipase A2 [Operophtera brumata]
MKYVVTHIRHGMRLRQLTDGRHLVQVIYNQNGGIQDCEYINEAKSARNFLKNLRKELKLALDEESYKITEKSFEEDKFFRHFRNVTFRILKDGESLPLDVASWLNYDTLKTECLRRHEEMKYMMESREGRSGRILSCPVQSGAVPDSWLKSTTNWETIEKRTDAVGPTTTAESISASLEEDSAISTSDLTRSRIADAIGESP